MLFIKACLPIGAQGVASYIAAWKALIRRGGDLSEREIQKSLFEHLYDNLNILDNKTNSIIQLNGIIIAAYVFTLSLTNMELPTPHASLFLVGSCYAVLAIGLCMRVIWVHWSSKADLREPASHMKALIRIRTQRTIEFRRAWTFTLLSMTALIWMIITEFILRVQADFGAFVFAGVIVHLFAVYVYDDMVLLANKRNLVMRLRRIYRAIKSKKMRWKIFLRAIAVGPPNHVQLQPTK